MFVISADQRASRSTDDLVAQWRDRLNQDHGDTLVLPADRNAGDEIQVLTADAATLVSMVLELLRSDRWSVGVGIGGVRTPLPAEVREASGPAFTAARAAVTEAKKRPSRLAVCGDGVDPLAWPAASDAQAVFDLVQEIRRRRTRQGWELFDVLGTVTTQAEAAAKLGISPAAASERAQTAGLRLEREALPTLIRLIEAVDRRLDPARNAAPGFRPDDVAADRLDAMTGSDARRTPAASARGGSRT